MNPISLNPISLGANGINFLHGALNGVIDSTRAMVTSFGGAAGSSDASIIASQQQADKQFERQMQMNMHFQEVSTRSNIEKSRHEAQMSVINNLRVR